MKDLTPELKEFVLQQGAHLVGIAPVDRFKGAPQGMHPGDLLEGAQSVIVYAIRFFRSVLACSNFKPEAHFWGSENVELFYKFLDDTINYQLQMVGIQTANLLSERHFKSLPLQSDGWPFFSFRHAAVLAGLGEIGLNNLLITPEYGPRVKLNCVITTAKLTPDPVFSESLCPGESCGLCLEAKQCFSKLEVLELAGKQMQVAAMPALPERCESDKDSGLCRKFNPEGKLPYIRFCWGICPAGQNLD